MDATRNSLSAVLATFDNAEHGVSALVVVCTRGGYNVTLRDVDADEYIPVAVHIADYDVACGVARAVAGLTSQAIGSVAV